INVRAGPGTDYPIVGVLVAGQHVPALGRSVGGDWVQIVYPGVQSGVAWAYSYLITLKGNLPVIEPPPTPTPLVTPTIDPTLASQFVIEIAPTRLPTYTSPPPLVIPTYTASSSVLNPIGVPMGFVIIGLAVIGVFGLLISLLRGR
ncbi:MAG: SH3 domain-containing protein, partial [Anaerolineales bacterium]|nr:SH3 domain-containing protein [Anaerolineales bacterium]